MTWEEDAFSPSVSDNFVSLLVAFLIMRNTELRIEIGKLHRANTCFSLYF